MAIVPADATARDWLEAVTANSAVLAALPEGGKGQNLMRRFRAELGSGPIPHITIWPL
jgi:hypothetical protein